MGIGRCPHLDGLDRWAQTRVKPIRDHSTAGVGTHSVRLVCATVWERKRTNGGGRCGGRGTHHRPLSPFPSHIGRWFSPTSTSKGRQRGPRRPHARPSAWVAWHRLAGWHGIGLADRFWSSSAFGAADGCRWRSGLSTPEDLGPGSSSGDQSTCRIKLPRIPLRAIASGSAGVVQGGFQGFSGLASGQGLPAPAKPSQGLVPLLACRS